MKKIVFFILFGFSLISFTGCGQVEPIVQDVCEITLDICNYANLLCSQFNPELLNKNDQEQLKQELLRVREILQAQVSRIETQAELNKDYKVKYFYYVDRLNGAVDLLNNKINKNENFAIE